MRANRHGYSAPGNSAPSLDLCTMFAHSLSSRGIAASCRKPVLSPYSRSGLRPLAQARGGGAETGAALRENDKSRLPDQHAANVGLDGARIVSEVVVEIWPQASDANVMFGAGASLNIRILSTRPTCPPKLEDRRRICAECGAKEGR